MQDASLDQAAAPAEPALPAGQSTLLETPVGSREFSFNDGHRHREGLESAWGESFAFHPTTRGQEVLEPSDSQRPAAKGVERAWARSGTPAVGQKGIPSRAVEVL
ncbi:unnamed protein product [Symbiodinium natans]|uniref:Uncharacterized protein n=1 Tax=Symbiodinium natans TaxID=878477 RepID=A0A812S625_9DINO|nr:unnamed protein product [Symbiodinium natans]